MITRKVKINDDPLMHRILELLKLNWQMYFNYRWREENMSVDWLTNLSFSLDSFNNYAMETPPCEVSSLPFNNIYFL